MPCPARRAEAIHLSPSGWHGCQFRLVRRYRTRNGTGKTTALRILTTLSRPDSGWARVAGHDVVREAAAVQRNIGVTAGPNNSVDFYVQPIGGSGWHWATTVPAGFSPEHWLESLP